LVQLLQIELYANVGAQVSEQGTTHHLCLLVSMRQNALATLELLDFQRGTLQKVNASQSMAPGDRIKSHTLFSVRDKQNHATSSQAT
jgi:hypothetical protein